jgi:phage baseplate assembly protein V
VIDQTEVLNRIDDLERRLGNVVRMGKIAKHEHINYETAKVRVTSGGNLTGWLRWSSRAGKSRDWQPPIPGEVVTILAPFGELNQGIVFPGTYQQEFPAPSQDENKFMRVFTDGASFEYDTKKNALLIKVGKVEIKNEQGELLSLISEALEVIATSKTPTMMGPQVAVEEAAKLPLIKTKLDSFREI